MLNENFLTFIKKIISFIQKIISLPKKLNRKLEETEEKIANMHNDAGLLIFLTWMLIHFYLVFGIIFPFFQNPKNYIYIKAVQDFLDPKLEFIVYIICFKYKTTYIYINYLMFSDIYLYPNNIEFNDSLLKLFNIDKNRYLYLQFKFYLIWLSFKKYILFFKSPQPYIYKLSIDNSIIIQYMMYKYKSIYIYILFKKFKYMVYTNYNILIDLICFKFSKLLTFIFYSLFSLVYNFFLIYGNILNVFLTNILMYLYNLSFNLYSYFIGYIPSPKLNFGEIFFDNNFFIKIFSHIFSIFYKIYIFFKEIIYKVHFIFFFLNLKVDVCKLHIFNKLNLWKIEEHYLNQKKIYFINFIYDEGLEKNIQYNLKHLYFHNSILSNNFLLNFENNLQYILYNIKFKLFNYFLNDKKILFFNQNQTHIYISIYFYKIFYEFFSDYNKLKITLTLISYFCKLFLFFFKILYSIEFFFYKIIFYNYYLYNFFLEIFNTFFNIVIFEIINIILILLFVLVGGILPLWERKYLALVQRRVGPKFVGYKGRLQFIADALKVLFKDYLFIYNTNKFFYFILPVMFLNINLLFFVNIIFYNNCSYLHVEYNILFLLFFSMYSNIMLFLVGYISKNKYTILSSNRILNLFFINEIFLASLFLFLFLLFNSFSFYRIFFFKKFILIFLLFIPIIPLIFYLFLIDINKVPFDLVEAESELIMGYHVEYSGFLFGLFVLVEYLHLFFFIYLLYVLFGFF